MKPIKINLEKSRKKHVLDIVRTIHRGIGGYVAFAAKTEGPLVNLCSCAIEDLERELPEIEHHLEADAYFTVNSMYRAQPYPDKLTGLPAVLRNEESLRFLNACYVDLDVGRLDSNDAAQAQTVNDVAAELTDLMQAGIIPQVSLYASSGQGCYVFWLLHDEKDNSQPPRYCPERLALYKGINRALCESLKHLAPDKTAVDGARFLRIPTTRHSKAGAEAAYHAMSYGDGELITYSLSELAQMMGVLEVDEIDEAVREWTEEIASPKKQPQTRRQPNKIAGYRELNAKRARDLIRLSQSRGGWKKGKRKDCLTLYADFLRRAGKEQSETIELIKDMAKRCVPPYPSDKNDASITDIVRYAFDRNIPNYKNVSLVRFLQIESDECRELELETILTSEVETERKKPLGGDRAIAKAYRHRLILDVFCAGKEMSIRELVRHLVSKGLSAAKSSIATDIKELREGGKFIIENRQKQLLNYS